MSTAPIMMPMQPDAAAQQMLIEQVRRLTDGIDRLNGHLSDMREQLARMETENQHTVERREKNEARLTKAEDRIDVLESWRSEQRGERSTIAVILGHPITMAIIGAVVGVLTAIKGGLLK